MTTQLLPPAASVPVPPPPENPPALVLLAALKLEGDDYRDYVGLLGRVSAAVKPRDIFEEIWVGDFIYHQLEIQKLRRIKSDLPIASIQKALIELLSVDPHT